MVVNRISNAEKQAKTLNEIESKFVAGVERNNLKALTLDELAHQFEEIGQQAQLLQGRILLEAKSRFETTNGFGAWIQEHGGTLCAVTKQHRTRLMNLAAFFDGDKRTLDKISITAAYEISAPINADIAIDVYEYARGKNLPISEIKRQIAIRKGETLPLPSDTSIESTSVEQRVEIAEENKHIEPLSPKLPDPATEITESSAVEFVVHNVLKDFDAGIKLKILRECLTIVNAEMRPK